MYVCIFVCSCVRAYLRAREPKAEMPCSKDACCTVTVQQTYPSVRFSLCRGIQFVRASNCQRRKSRFELLCCRFELRPRQFM